MPLNPFSIHSTLLAKHAQHVVLIHFPVALFTTSVAFDFLSRWMRRPALKTAAYLNLLIAAASTIPVICTGLLAWQWQLEGQKLKGILRAHLVLALISTCLIWLVLWLQTRARRQQKLTTPAFILLTESIALIGLALTAHLGGFLSGVST
jgi:uncharacterized membrane protein